MHINSDQRHKQELFMELFMPVNRNISNYCRAIVNNNEDAKDLLSETLLIAYENFNKLKDRKAFKYYLFGIASWLFKRKLRRKKFREDLNEEMTSEFPDPGPNPDYLTDINGKQVVDINTAVDVSTDKSSENKMVNTAVKIQTMVPVLLRKQYFNKYKNYLLWFSANENFINALPKNISIDMGKAYKMYMYKSIQINKNVSVQLKSDEPKSMYFPDSESKMPELNKFKLYPNPVSDYLNLDFETNQPVSFNMCITDISGKQIIGYNREFSMNKAGLFNNIIRI